MSSSVQFSSDSAIVLSVNPSVCITFTTTTLNQYSWSIIVNLYDKIQNSYGFPWLCGEEWCQVGTALHGSVVRNDVRQELLSMALWWGIMSDRNSFAWLCGEELCQTGTAFHGSVVRNYVRQEQLCMALWWGIMSDRNCFPWLCDEECCPWLSDAEWCQTRIVDSVFSKLLPQSIMCLDALWTVMFYYHILPLAVSCDFFPLFWRVG